MGIWKAVEETGNGKIILRALALALRGMPIPDIARETGLPASSLYDIRKHDAFSYRGRQRKRAARGKIGERGSTKNTALQIDTARMVREQRGL